MNEIEKAIAYFRNAAISFDIDNPKSGLEAIKVRDLAITALEQKLNDRWIPVENMPKDRGYPPVICCHVEDKWTDSAIVTEKGNYINSDGCEIYPTHWKPLPLPKNP